MTSISPSSDRQLLRLFANRMSESEIDEIIIKLKNANIRTLAGAGAGKTRTIIRWIKKLLMEKKATPDQIVAITYTDKAADSLKSRIYSQIRKLGNAQLVANLHKMFIGTIHSYAKHLLQVHFGLRNFEVLDGITEKIFTQKIGPKIGLKDTLDHLRQRFHVNFRSDNYGYICSTFCASVNIVDDELLDLNRLCSGLTGNPLLMEFVEAARTYYQELTKQRLITFSQLIRKAKESIESKPEVLSNLRYVFVDEYHDVNHAQIALIEILAKTARVIVVGDIKQTIYNWRGSHWQNLMDFDQISPDRDQIDFTIEANHRSLPKIIECSNRTAELANIDPLKLQAQPQRDDAKGLVAQITFNSAEQEARYIIAQIKHIVKRYPTLRYGDFAVLCRTIQHSGYQFVKACIDLGVPYRIGGKVGLFNRKEIQAVVRFMIWLSDQGVWELRKHDTLILELLHIHPDNIDPERGEDLVENGLTLWIEALKEAKVQQIPERMVLKTKLEHWKKDCLTKIEALKDSIGKTKSEIARTIKALEANGFGKRLEDLSEEANPNSMKFGVLQHQFDDYLHGLVYLDLYAQLLADLGIKSFDYKDPLHVALLGNLGRFSQLINEFEWIHKRGGDAFPLDAFLPEMNAFFADYQMLFEENQAKDERDPHAVNLFTIHQAKGLEWPVVFIPSINMDLFPIRNLEQKPSNFLTPESGTCPFPIDRYATTLPDEARLLYTAQTRARDVLVMSTHSDRPSKLWEYIDQSTVCQWDATRPLIMHSDFPPESSFKKSKETEELDAYSMTEIVDMHKCEIFYFFRHHLQFAARINRFMGFGKMIHYLLQRLVELSEQGLDLSNPAALNEHLQVLLKKDFRMQFFTDELNENIRSSVAHSLQGYVQKFQKEFRQAKTCEAKLELIEQNAVIVGIADIILNNNATGSPGTPSVSIWEHKTAITDERESFHFQVQLYMNALNDMCFNPQQGLLGYFREIEVETVDTSPKTLAETRATAMNLIKKIRKNEFSPPTNPEKCKKVKCDYCDYCKYLDFSQI
jgi:DNA helicase-2/ATP-dependent DNA helicase PcrA